MEAVELEMVPPHTFERIAKDFEGYVSRYTRRIQGAGVAFMSCTCQAAWLRRRRLKLRQNFRTPHKPQQRYESFVAIPYT